MFVAEYQTRKGEWRQHSEPMRTEAEAQAYAEWLTSNAKVIGAVAVRVVKYTTTKATNQPTALGRLLG